MNKLKQIHAYALRNGIDYPKTLTAELLQIPNGPHARTLFNHLPKSNVFIYNKLIQACSSQNQPYPCLSLYSRMCISGFSPNEHTFTFLFAACAALPSALHGQMVHTQFMKSGFESDVFVSTALIDMYGKVGMLLSARKVFDEMIVRSIPSWNSLIASYSRCGDMERALEVFRLMPFRNVVSWTAMISGYSRNGRYAKALDMFFRMEKEKGVGPNQVTIASVLPACANLGALEVGERIEAYARGNGMLSDLYVSNALLEMYARCGKIDVARQLFDEIGRKRNICSWNSMIMGLAVHGRSIEALQHYYQMLNEGTPPDDVTFVGLLLACTHGGMVEEGWKLFESMKRSFNIIPKLEHYGCMVDLLGRAGQLGEAYGVIKSMPTKPDSVTWGALLGACSFHKNVEFAEIAAEELVKLEPWNSGNYVILSNIYASAGRWDGVARLRKLMKRCLTIKAAGYSFILEGTEVHKFIVEDVSHPRCNEIYRVLNEISQRMKLQGIADDFESELEELYIVE